MKPSSAQDQQRRLYLRVAVKLMLAVAVMISLFVLFSGIRSGTREYETAPTMRVNISAVQPGEIQTLVWEGRPVIVYRRQDSDFSQLREADDRLADPSSSQSRQPDDYRGDYRSASPELFVAIALGTDQGCSLNYLPAENIDFQGEPWAGGFVDTCRKARYDTAGRVYRSQYADKNLVIPPYTVKGDFLILGGNQ